jgi:hypothetical protein
MTNTTKENTMTDSKAMRVEVTRISNNDGFHELQLRVDKIEAQARIAELEAALAECIAYIESNGASALGVQAKAKVTLTDFPPEVENSCEGYDSNIQEKGRFEAILARRAALGDGA